MELKKLDINKLFVKFLEWDVKKNGDVQIPVGLYKPTKSNEIESRFYDYEMDIFDIEFLTDWSYLMAVVEKIEKVRGLDLLDISKGEVKIKHYERSDLQYFKVVSYGGLLENYKEKTKIDAVVISCYTYIKWYFENIHFIYTT